jgi:hypothetical protein
MRGEPDSEQVFASLEMKNAKKENHRAEGRAMSENVLVDNFLRFWERNAFLISFYKSVLREPFNYFIHPSFVFRAVVRFVRENSRVARAQ